jgi:AraC-like DNA-binding protein
MGIWLLLISLQSFLIILKFQFELIYEFIPVIITVSYGPLLYLYVKSIIEPDITEKKYKILHFIPVFVAIILIKHPQILSFFCVIVGVIYILITQNRIHHYRKSIKYIYSNIEKINLNWLKRLIIGLITIWLGAMCLLILVKILQFKLRLEWFFLVVPIFIFYISYYAIKQNIINKILINTKHQKKNFSKYEKSCLTNKEKQKILNQLNYLVESQQLYLNPNFNLIQLSEISNIPSHHITQTLNTLTCQNFHKYINRYRVHEFIKQFKSNSHLSILAIALDCGFNSKSSFNRIFRDETGYSPTQYKKTYL